MSRPWSVSTTGVIVEVRLTPRSSKDCVEGVQTLSDGRSVLAARVRAPPEDGRANEALLRLLAATLDVRVSDCILKSGGKSRLKVVSVTGNPDELSIKAESLCAAGKE
ncbi:MAG: DUF167 family protein [Beijerinckiaceae bacterium]|nr:DUF167 family protein [Beijerinckiaceae bacterium]